MTAQFYCLIKRDEKGHIEAEASSPNNVTPLLDELSLNDKTTSIVVCTSVKEAYANECKVIWDRQAGIMYKTFTSTLIYVILALLFLIYLLFYY